MASATLPSSQRTTDCSAAGEDRRRGECVRPGAGGAPIGGSVVQHGGQNMQGDMAAAEQRSSQDFDRGKRTHSLQGSLQPWHCNYATAIKQAETDGRPRQWFGQAIDNYRSAMR